MPFCKNCGLEPEPEQKLKRHGECNPSACGGSLCCRIGPWVTLVDPDDEDEIRFIEGYGWEKIAEYKGDLIYASMQVCRHMDLTDGSCTIYETRPEICKKFPDGKDKLFWAAVKAQCSFRFTKEKRK